MTKNTEAIADQDIETINQEWFDAADRGDWETVRDLLSPEFRIHYPPSLGFGDGPVDRGTFVDMLQGFEFRHEVHDVLRDGNKLAVRLEIHLTQLEEFQGIPPSGEEMTTSGIVIRRFEDGKIAEEWVMEDTLALMDQLGVVDIPEE